MVRRLSAAVVAAAAAALGARIYGSLVVTTATTTSCASERSVRASEMTPWRVAVVGATGATGRRVLARLAADPRVGSVTAVVRRDFDLPEVKNAAKIKNIIVPNLLDLPSTLPSPFSGVDVVFCTLGTTRATAGSASKFVEVDRDMVAAAARTASAEGVKHFSLVTSMSANLSFIPRSVTELIHPLLYLHTKHEAEQAVIASGVPRVSIFQPGPLDRSAESGHEADAAEAWDPARWLERTFKFMNPTKVDTLAVAMIEDALSRVKGSDDQGSCADFFSTSQLTEIAKAANM